MSVLLRKEETREIGSASLTVKKRHPKTTRFNSFTWTDLSLSRFVFVFKDQSA
jgi:hypothetical protein